MVKLSKFVDVHEEFSCRGLRSDRCFSAKDEHFRGELVKFRRSEDGHAVEPDIPYHYHTQRHLYIFGLKGKATYLVNGEKYTVEPGTMLYIEPGDAHHAVDIGRNEGEVLEVYYDGLRGETVQIPEK